MNYNENLLSIRQNFIQIFKKYEYIAIPTLKFISIFMCVNILQDIVRYNGKLSNILVVAAISLIGSFVSAQTILLGSVFLVSFCVAATNLILGIITFVALVVIYFAFMRFFPKDSIYCIVTIIAFSLNMPIILPILVPIVSGYSSIFAIIIGTIIWFMVPSILPILSDIPMDLSKITEWMNGIKDNNLESIVLNSQMIIIITVFFIVFSVVYVIRRQSLEHSPYIAIAVGAVINILGFGMGKLFINGFTLGIGSIIVWTIIGATIGIIIQFLSVVLDYDRVENVQFEDEDNYYYVKVVPKIKEISKKSAVKHVYTNNENNIDLNNLFVRSGIMDED